MTNYFVLPKVRVMGLPQKPGYGNKVEIKGADIFMHAIHNRERLGKMSIEEIKDTVVKWRQNGYGDMPIEEFSEWLKMAVDYGIPGFKNKEEWQNALREINFEEIDTKEQPLDVKIHDKVDKVLSQ